MYYLFITQDSAKELKDTFKLGMLADEQGKLITTTEQLLKFAKEAFEGGTVKLAAYSACKTEEDFLKAKTTINTILGKISEKVR